MLKVVQSAEARKPLVEALAWEIERVLPENESGPETVVATTLPFALTERSELARPVIAKDEEVAEAKVFLPVKVLLSERSVEDAALIVIFDEPLNETPLIVRAVWSAVAVPAFPLTDPVMSDEKTSLPLKVLLSLSNVEDAALMVIGAVPSKFTPLIARAVASLVAVPALPLIEALTV